MNNSTVPFKQTLITASHYNKDLDFPFMYIKRKKKTQRTVFYCEESGHFQVRS